MNRTVNVKKLAFSSVLAAMSLTLYILEALIPPIVPIPGVKIGLAYIPIIFIIFIGGSWKIKDGAAVLAVRIILSSLIAGSLMSLCFSMAGGMLSITVMAVMKLAVKEPWGIIPAGVFSAAAHNIGQLSAAMIFYTYTVWAYLPYLLISAVISGLFTGLLIYSIIRKPSGIISKIKNI